MKKNLLAVLSVVVIVLVGALLVRFATNSGEDMWICVDGQWTQHGNPTSSAPTTGCGTTATTTEEVRDTQETTQASGEQKEVQDGRTGEFKNGEAYTTYATNEFEVKYPADWLQVEKSQVVGGVLPEVAVTNVKCSFVVKKTPLPQGTSFKEYVQNLVDVEMKKMPVRVLKQEVGDTAAYFESEISTGSTTVTSISRSFLTSKENSIGVAFLAQKEDFERSCRPILTEVFDSVIVK